MASLDHIITEQGGSDSDTIILEIPALLGRVLRGHNGGTLGQGAVPLPEGQILLPFRKGISLIYTSENLTDPDLA